MINNKNESIKLKMVAKAVRVPKEWEKRNFEPKNVWQLNVKQQK
jgi:hypothetical protein